MISMRDNIMVDARYVNLKNPRKNIMGRRWRLTSNLIIGVTDLRARKGTFTSPWNAPTNPLYRMPEFQFIDDKLSDLLDRRAIEILDESRISGKTVMVLWSGGIDSTAVLASMIKNWPEADLQRICVVLSTLSMLENFEFYKKFISGKLNCLHYSSLDMTNDLLDKNIVLHGDPADCLFGPSMPAYREFVDRGQHHESYKKHLKRMAELVQPSESSAHYVEGFGDWWVEKVTDNLEQVSPPGVESVAAWWWWTYYNFKWQFSCQRPFFFCRDDFKDSISDDNLISYAKNVYFGTDYFQQWSHSNIDRLIETDHTSHKIDARRYIFELDHNEIYFNKKTKVAGAPANSESRTSVNLPLCYDKNWVGYYFWEDQLDAESYSLLETYKG